MMKKLLIPLILSATLLAGCNKDRQPTADKKEEEVKVSIHYPASNPTTLTYLSKDWEEYPTNAVKSEGYELFKDVLARCKFYRSTEMIGPHPGFTFKWQDKNMISLKLGGDEKNTSLFIDSTFIDFEKKGEEKYLSARFSDEKLYNRITAFSDECVKNKQ